jgi:hypothetical protein
MRRLLLLALITFVCARPGFAQKISTVLGDAWIGEVVSTDEGTREIVIRSPGKGGTETFAGTLEEGSKLKERGGGLHELKVSEIPVGTRVRVFYRTKQQDVGGRKVKVHRIFRLDLLGKDEHARLREMLNLDSSAPVALAESAGLPAASPLKVHPAIELPYVRAHFAAWLSKWNKEQAAKYGSIELVADKAQADISLVVYRGSDTMVMPLPIDFYDAAGNSYGAEASHVTAYIVTGGDGGPRVLWKQVIVNLSMERRDTAALELEKAFEKRMKARAK